MRSSRPGSRAWPIGWTPTVRCRRAAWSTTCASSAASAMGGGRSPTSTTLVVLDEAQDLAAGDWVLIEELGPRGAAVGVPRPRAAVLGGARDPWLVRDALPASGRPSLPPGDPGARRSLRREAGRRATDPRRARGRYARHRCLPSES